MLVSKEWPGKPMGERKKNEISSTAVQPIPKINAGFGSYPARIFCGCLVFNILTGRCFLALELN